MPNLREVQTVFGIWNGNADSSDPSLINCETGFVVVTQSSMSLAGSTWLKLEDKVESEDLKLLGVNPERAMNTKEDGY